MVGYSLKSQLSEEELRLLLRKSKRNNLKLAILVGLVFFGSIELSKVTKFYQQIEYAERQGIHSSLREGDYVFVNDLGRVFCLDGARSRKEKRKIYAPCGIDYVVNTE